MLTTFFQVICSFKNRAAIMEITTGFKELIRDAREPDNRAVPPSCNMNRNKISQAAQDQQILPVFRLNLLRSAFQLQKSIKA